MHRSFGIGCAWTQKRSACMCIILLALAVPELKKGAPACASFFWHWLCPDPSQLSCFRNLEPILAHTLRPTLVLFTTGGGCKDWQTHPQWNPRVYVPTHTHTHPPIHPSTHTHTHTHTHSGTSLQMEASETQHCVGVLSSLLTCLV